jgi:hypothetical protein
MNNQFKDLFISYGRRESLGLVGRLHQQLKLAGYDAWFDKVNIPDYEQHKILLARALKWETENHKPSFLLRGHNLEKAKTWLRLNETRKQHPPLALHKALITASEPIKGQLGTEVFLSYSRKDSDFARQLNQALQEAGKTTWFDQESISAGIDFEQEIFKGIDGCDNFVFIVSPDAVESEYCENEVNYACQQNKRFISVLHRETQPTTMPKALRVINWIDFKDIPFNQSFPELIQAIELDRKHAHQHTVLQQRACDWAENNKSGDFLLNITACQNAEIWQKKALVEKKQPPPTQLQREFVQESRKTIQKANRRRSILFSFVGVVTIVTVVLSWFAFNTILNKRKVVYEMDLLHALSELAVNSSALIHELQKERGISAGFLGSQGQQFSQELKLQRLKTDDALKAFQLFIQNFEFESFNGGIKTKLDFTLTQLDDLKTQRHLVDNFEISAKEEILAYTRLTESLLTSINYLSIVITHFELANGVMAYVNILYAKEKAGLERATLNKALSQGYFTLDLYKTFEQLVQAQENYVKDFLFFATPKQRAIYHKMMDNEFVDEVEKIRDTAFKTAAKFELIQELRLHISYGGLLHQLNDYILWGKQQYIDAFNEQYQTAMTIFNRYKNLPYVSALELKSLNQIEQTFNIYQRYLKEAIALIKQQKSTDEIENLIQIDDAVTLKALNNLLINIHLKTQPTYWWKMATSRIELFKKIEYQLSLDLTTSTHLFKQQAQYAFTLYLTITCIIIVLAFILYYFKQTN